MARQESTVGACSFGATSSWTAALGQSNCGPQCAQPPQSAGSPAAGEHTNLQQQQCIQFNHLLTVSLDRCVGTTCGRRCAAVPHFRRQHHQRWPRWSRARKARGGRSLRALRKKILNYFQVLIDCVRQAAITFLFLKQQ